MSAWRGAALSPFGGGTKVVIASSNSSIPTPVFAEQRIASPFLNPKVCVNSSSISSGREVWRSILFITGMISRLPSMARNALATVCASTP